MIAALLFSGAAALAAAAHPQVVLEEHPTLRFSEHTFVLGRMRWSYEHRGPDDSLPAGTPNWGFVRRRFSVEGAIGGLFAFEIEGDLEGDERWKDVYGEYTPSDAFHLRAGKSTIPFGYERTTSTDVLDFAYRSMIATKLVPPRDRGILALGSVLGGRLGYDAGVYEDGGGTFVGRLVARPTVALETGTGLMYGRLRDDVNALSGETALGVPFFRAEPFADGHRRRVSAHAVYRPGPAALKAEYIAVRDDSGGEPLDADGWYLSGSVVLTGESDADAHHPIRPITRGGPGSIELAARTETLAFERAGTRLEKARAHTLGVTWQPHRFFRIQWNAIRDELRTRKMWTRVLRFHLTI